MTFAPNQYSVNASTIAKGGLLADLKRLPLVIKLVLLFMVIVFVWKQPLLGFNISGLAWVIPLAFSLMVVVRNMNRVTFPYFLWLPWALLLFTYLAITDYSLLDPRVIPIQRTLQLLSPLVVGMAVSTWRPTADDLRAFFATCRRLGWLILLIVGLKTGVLLTGRLPVVTGLAAEAIAITLLCTLFVTNYIIIRSKKDLLLWALLAFVPVIALTRMAIAAALLTFPLSFAPLPLMRRIGAVIVIVLAGAAIFNSERVQNKMFYSGRGSFRDIGIGNKDFATSGRSYVFERMAPAVAEELWVGHGTGMAETFTYKITGKTAYPHNDWLLTMYDYGLLGTVVFIICCLSGIVHVLRQLRFCQNNETRILLLTGAAAYVPFALLMFTDNIMVYASYFGNLHFCILGLVYASLRAQTEVQSQYR